MATLTAVIRLPRLRAHQSELHRAMRRWNVWVCHRRFGKTLLTLLVMLKKAFECDKPAPRYAYVAPLYRQAKEIAWDYLKRLAAQIPGTEARESELAINLPGGRRIQLLGADNPDSLRGRYLDGVVLDEYAQIKPGAWQQVIRPTLSDRQGWAIKIGTVNGRNHFYDDYQEACTQMAAGHPDYHAAVYRASETGILPQAELDSARLTMRDRRGTVAGDVNYLQEYECQWDTPIPGAVYADELAEMAEQGRIGAFPYTSSLPVQTAWDFGWSDATAIWYFQEWPDKLVLIDYREGTHLSLQRWVRVVRELPYQYDHSRFNLTRAPYERHFAPHDLTQTEYGYGKTRFTIARETVQYDDGVTIPGLFFSPVPCGPLEDGIEATRRLLRRVAIDENACQAGLNALRSYQYAWDDAKQVYGKSPQHDWASHGADALRTLAVGLLPTMQPLAPPVPAGSWEQARRNVKRAKQGLPLRTFRVGSTG